MRGSRPSRRRRPHAAGAYDAILGFGGSVHPDQHHEHPWLTAEKRFLAEALRERVPMLGVCLGAELIAVAEGAAVRRIPRPEIGWYDVTLTAAGLADPVLGPVGRNFSALEWHSYEAVLPEGATALARSDSSLQAYRIGGRAWGIQFHAEVTAADFQHWLETYPSFDEDAIEAGIDVDAIAAATDERIEAWNEHRARDLRALPAGGFAPVTAGYRMLFDTVLRRLPPERAHALAFSALDMVTGRPRPREWLRARTHVDDELLRVRALGLTFPSPLGVAGGLDKDAEHFEGLGALGFGFVEVGTVTPPRAGAEPGTDPRARHR